MKKFLTLALCAAVTLTTSAQSGTNSPYSQYGLGALSEQTSGYNRGMNGLGYGFRDHNQVNYLNPASYSHLDSLTFIFDAGVSAQVTNFEENGTRINANNAVFEYAVMGFRMAKHLGMSVGLIPFTNIGYSYSTSDYLGSSSVSTTTYTNTYSGSGGLHQVYIGAGWEPFKGFSIGANASYLWGTYTRSLINSYSDSYINTIAKYYTGDVHSYKIDLGAQYTARFSKKDELTIGVTYSPGHNLGADPECMVISTNSQTAIADTTSLSVADGLELPTMIGAGFMFSHDNRFRFGVDYQLQKWSECKYPVYTLTNGQPQYTLESDQFSDRHKVTVGGDYCRNENSRKFMHRIHWRAGVSYATPYLKINDQDGPKELSVSAGVGIPIVNGWNNRSILNLSAQWSRLEATGLIKENTFRINIGITFNERWFAKWKVE